MAFSGAQVTRLGLAGFPRGLYGSFAGKTEAEPEPEVVVEEATGGWLRDPYKTRQQQLEEARAERERLGVAEALRAIPEPEKPKGRAGRKTAERLRKRQAEADARRLLLTLEAMEAAEQVERLERDRMRRVRAALLMLAAA